MYWSPLQSAKQEGAEAVAELSRQTRTDCHLPLEHTFWEVPTLLFLPTT
jgi:hypothetical protein